MIEKFAAKAAKSDLRLKGIGFRNESQTILAGLCTYVQSLTVEILMICETW
jgi:hypothetical protein